MGEIKYKKVKQGEDDVIYLFIHSFKIFVWLPIWMAHNNNENTNNKKKLKKS